MALIKQLKRNVVFFVIIGEEEQIRQGLKVARLDFSGGIPPKFEH